MGDTFRAGASLQFARIDLGEMTAITV